MNYKDKGIKYGIKTIKNLEAILKSERERLRKLIQGESDTK